MTSELSFASRRSAVHATNGMVGASQPLAAQAGLRVLMQGGNAADAAVATAAVLALTEPCSTGLGGDAFALTFDAATKTVTALNGSGRAPSGLTLQKVHDDGFTDELPRAHAHTITVPGACAAWCDLHERHGSGKLDRAAVLADAIALAEDGFPVAPLTAYYWNRGARSQLVNSRAGRELLIDGRAPRAGERFRNPTLAKTLRTIATGGADAFYKGDIGQRIAATVQSHGGVMTAADLAAHKSTWDEPISVPFVNWRVWECPPNGQGITALIALNILRAFGTEQLGERHSIRRYHLLIEALRLAFADARAYIADPRMADVPIAELLSLEYAHQRASEIREDRATADAQAGQPIKGSETVYFSVVDGAGNACSVVNSNYMGFGTGIVPEGCGFTLQNRGHNFSLDPTHPNVLAPGKRSYHTIIPAMVTHEGGPHDGDLAISFGVMGGFMQPQGHVQVLLNLLDGLDPQAALDEPRICLERGSGNGPVALEDGIVSDTLDWLKKLGHDVHLVTGQARSLFGRGQIITRDPATGVLSGGSDARADGQVVGW